MSHFDYPEIPLFQFLIDSTNRNPEKTAIACEEKQVTYRELLEKSEAFSHFLRQRGIVKGDRVMISLWNVPEFAVAFYGILMAGGIVTTAHPLSQTNELSRLLEDSGSKAIVANSSVIASIDTLPQDRQPELIINVEDDEWEQIFIEAKSNGRFPYTEVSPDDIAVLQYTGGTTGLPKGAIMLHRNLVANAIQNAKWWTWEQDDIVMGVLTLVHTWGLCCCLNSVIYCGATVILVPHFDPKETIGTIEKHRATILYGSATMFHRLCDELEQNGGEVTSLRLAKAGAMPVPNHLVERWQKITGLPLLLGYGLTEASPETHNSPPNKPKHGSIGVPIFDTEAKIIDTEFPDKSLPIGAIGELCIRGPQVGAGYWNQPEDTKKTFTDGWLHTGDLAYQDEEGYYYLVDRMKDLIKFRGYSVFPAELENILLQHPGVQDCLVVGEPDSEAGEIPVAHIVPKADYWKNAQEFIDYCAARISPLKTIRKVVFHNKLPRTPVGKGLRRKLKI
jgi:long-chain acyl-CoA synthetase